MTTDTRTIEIAEITAMMSTQGGRAFVSRILDKCRVFRSTFDPDTHKHAYNAGKRDVGLAIIEDLQQACPDKYLQLLDERNDEK